MGGTPPEGWQFTRIVASWDTAFKESEINDPSACTVWGILGNQYTLLWVRNQRYSFPDLKKEAIRIWERNIKCWQLPPTQVITLVEDRASGQSLIQELQRTTSMPVIAIKPEANKEVRFQEVTSIIEAGRVRLPEFAHWLTDYETQLIQFPLSKHDDMVDSTSQFLRWAAVPKFKRSIKPLFWK
jgi:predicted phage terminase large subunit-like protein